MAPGPGLESCVPGRHPRHPCLAEAYPHGDPLEPPLTQRAAMYTATLQAKLLVFVNTLADAMHKHGLVVSIDASPCGQCNTSVTSAPPVQ